ncbi:hypothetical protein [Falsiroseomonas tokyonensis]|uniref:Uncharacterized protein n=1 Tax=Falsiroseomonas tokyonensis TaxID=430521 RepID=A0ABV7BYX7_9PROT|nr:hypothetical protein [Falsiroseomonas tokyonensis]MBU8540796.1 hypothetical protein [Falsiroseomonas tokyonensis]
MMDMSTYTATNLMQSLDMCPWSVRDEAHKRHSAMATKMARLRKQMAALEAQAAEMGEVFEAALARIETEQAA